VIRFPGGAIPAPEPQRRRVFIRAFALSTIALSVVYLGWRAFATLNLEVWWIALPLLLFEAHNTLGLALFTFALWDIDIRPRLMRVDPNPDRSVAVLIPTYNEPTEVLLPTIAAAVALEPGHETWVLDDGRRNEVRELAEALGARYLTRPDNVGAKAGNLNHALPHVEAELVAVLDADHVPSAGFLLRTLPYFEDERVAVVQTPQDFYNLDSFEHERASDDSSRVAYLEEAVFYRVIAPGKNRWEGAFWCGTGAVIRREALNSVGGVSTDSVTEDIETSIRMLRRGWSIVYHNEVLARGLAPSDAVQYMTQRNRWALGAMQTIRNENPLFGRGLKFTQRLAFMTTLGGWFDSWRTLGFMLIAPLVLTTGASPIDAPGYLYGPFFVITFAMQFFALRLLARGHFPPILSLVFDVLRLPAVIPATLALVLPGAHTFKVTPKGRVGDERPRAPLPRLLVALLAAHVVAGVWFALTVTGLTPTAYREPAVTIGAVFFASLNGWLLVTALRRIRADRFAGERRASVRLPVDVEADIDGASCIVEDLSITGAQIVLPFGGQLEPGSEATLTLHLPDGPLRLWGRVLRPLGGDALPRFGFAFADGQLDAVARIALSLFGGAPDAPDEHPVAA
jgi:cellulose synthase/poly-beta-1,6-N-acetylglucosamine synthase-like glycosyltransferase